MAGVKAFDFVNSVNMGKKDIMVTPDDEKVYVPFMTNRSLSYFQETALIANEMNLSPHLDNKLQYHFLLNILRKRKRFSKWNKPETVADIDAVKEYPS